MSELPKLNILPVNKTVVFYSPVEGKDVLVRTGTIGDGSCFFHSLLHAYSKDYVSMNSTGRAKFVKRLRSSISTKIDKDKWESLSNGMIAKIPFQENINSILSEFYKVIKNGMKGRTKSVRKVIRLLIKDENNDIEAYKLVTSMIELEKGFEKNILPSVYEKCNESSLDKCKKTLVKYSLRYYMKEFDKLDGQLEQNQINFYVSKLNSLVQAVVDEAEDSAYSEYINSLEDSSKDVDTYTIGLISEKFNRDIYFIDGRNRMPYRNSGSTNIRKRKSMLVMWTGGCHYEIIGRLLPGNRIQREFEHNDPLIKRIYTYLCEPENIQNEYPNLVPYLPKELRQKFNFDVSDSEEDRRSERSQRSELRDRQDNRDEGDIGSVKSELNDESDLIDLSDHSDEEYEKSSAYEKSDSEYEDIEPKRQSVGQKELYNEENE